MRTDVKSLLMIANATVVIKAGSEIVALERVSEDGAFEIPVDAHIGPISVEVDLWGASAVPVDVEDENVEVTMFWAGAASS